MVMSVGYQSVDIVDPAKGPTFPMLVMYPTSTPERVEQIGPFSLSVAVGATPLEGEYPLVIVSHGSGGSHLTHRELARHLASRGFVVGVPEHPFNNRNDNSLADTVELLAERPRNIRTGVDWFFERSPFSDLLKPHSFSIVGHSIGAYTALAVAGGVPTSLPHQTADRKAKRIEVDADPRVKSLVLLAPATPWFRLRGALDRVHAPILMMASYHDALAPYFYMCQLVLDGVPDVTKVDYRLVENAGHYSFLSPWPDSMKSPALPPSQDPPGFDRRRFLDGMYVEIADFLSPLATPLSTGAARRCQ
jgi:predicted dienelactone hydrolase